MGRRLLQSERNANLLVDVLRSLVADRVAIIHDFVIMPDHLHVLLTVDKGTTIEKTMQLIKGRFSFRLSREFGHKGEVWQRGFSEVQVIGDESFEYHREYIAQNLVKAGLVRGGKEFPFCFRALARRKVVEGEQNAERDVRRG
jgi:putative transposase